jgi:hypothetical protein
MAASIAFAVPAHAQGSDATARYQVNRGDTLFGLAARYLVSEAAGLEVGRINRIRDPRRIPVGTSLSIPQRLLKSTAIELRILTFSGSVNIASGGQRPAPFPGMILAEGSEIETGANGFITVSGSDGSRFTLPSYSRVRIVRARRYVLGAASDIDLAVRKGRAELRAAPQKPGSEFRVRTPIAVSAVRGTAYRIGLADDAAASFAEVTEGLVAIDTSRTTAAVEAGFGAASRADGTIVKEALLPAPALLAPGKVQTESLVGFAVSPVAGARAYRLQVARDAGFVDILAELVSAEPHGEFADIGNGTFFVRSTAIAASGIEGLAETNSFRRQRVGLKASVGEAGASGGLRFNWHAQGDGTALYRLQLGGSDANAPLLIDHPGLTEPGLTLTGLATGAYRWRVGVIMATPDGAAEAWTPFQEIRINN